MTVSSMQFNVPDSERHAMAGVLELLARFWARELDRHDLLEFANSEMAPFWKSLGGWLPESAEEVADQLIDETAVDYCQLLVGPRHQIPPVQSVWTSGNYGSELAQSMQQFVDALPGFEPCCPIVDHFAVQLQYASALFSIKRARLDSQALENLDALAERFFQSHLQWPAHFLNLVEAGAQTEFYQGLARVTRNAMVDLCSSIPDGSVTHRSL